MCQKVHPILFTLTVLITLNSAVAGILIRIPLIHYLMPNWAIIRERGWVQELQNLVKIRSFDRSFSSFSPWMDDSMLMNVKSPFRLCPFLPFHPLSFSPLIFMSTPLRIISVLLSRCDISSTPIAVLPLSHCSPPLLFHSSAPQRANHRTVI